MLILAKGSFFGKCDECPKSYQITTQTHTGYKHQCFTHYYEEKRQGA